VDATAGLSMEQRGRHWAQHMLGCKPRGALCPIQCLASRGGTTRRAAAFRKVEEEDVALFFPALFFLKQREILKEEDVRPCPTMALKRDISALMSHSGTRSQLLQPTDWPLRE